MDLDLLSPLIDYRLMNYMPLYSCSDRMALKCRACLLLVISVGWHFLHFYQGVFPEWGFSVLLPVLLYWCQFSGRFTNSLQNCDILPWLLQNDFLNLFRSFQFIKFLVLILPALLPHCMVSLGFFPPHSSSLFLFFKKF